MKIITTLLLLVLCAAPASAFQPNQPEMDGPLTVQVKGDKVTATKPSGKLAWAIQHHSVNRDQRTKEIEYPIVGPVEFKGETMYAVRGDLLTLDTKLGRILVRQQYPALISDLIVEGDKLFVELDIRNNAFGETTKVRTPYRSGFVPGRGPWETFGMVATRTSHDVPKSLRDAKKFAKRKDFTAERIMLRNAENSDPTNPMFPAYRGLAAHADGDVDAANTAFAKAIVATGLWHEKLVLCGLLERAQRPGLAQATCKAARDAMVETGIRPEAMLSLVSYVVVTTDLRIAMESAMKREDLESVDRIAGYTHDLFPNVEAGFVAFSTLSDWFAERNDSKRAQVWAARANEVKNSPMTYSLFGRARTVDLLMLLLAALFFAMPIAGFALGLRRLPDGKEPRRAWLPRVSLLDGLVVVALLLAVLPVSMRMMAEVAVIGDTAAAPIAVFHEGYGSPDVVDWAAGMQQGGNHDEVLAFARHEFEAVAAGKRVTQDPPSITAPFELVEELGELKGRHEALQMDFMAPSLTDFSVPNPTPFVFPGAFFFLLFAIGGRGIRRKMPSIADKLAVIIPGTHAGPGSTLVLTALLAGLLYLATPLGTILQEIATPSFGKYFGLGDLGIESLESLYPSDVTTAWVTVVTVLLVHVVTTLLARKRWSTSPDQGAG